jgi:hypothetical protein
MYFDERVVEKSAFYSNNAETLCKFDVKFLTKWLNLESIRKADPNS